MTPQPGLAAVIVLAILAGPVAMLVAELLL